MVLICFVSCWIVSVICFCFCISWLVWFVCFCMSWLSCFRLVCICLELGSISFFFASCCFFCSVGSSGCIWFGFSCLFGSLLRSFWFTWSVVSISSSPMVRPLKNSCVSCGYRSGLSARFLFFVLIILFGYGIWATSQWPVSMRDRKSVV